MMHKNVFSLSEIESLCDTDFESLRRAVNAESARRASKNPVSERKARITRMFKEWNHYESKSKPFIGRILDWPVGKPPKLEFGRYLGDLRGGEAEISASTGDLIYWAHKFEPRFSNKSTSGWGVVEDNGELRLLTQTQARHIFETSTK